MLPALGWLSTLCAATLSLVTFIGPALHGATGLYINLGMGIVFALWAAFLGWRTRVLARLRNRRDEDPALRQLLRIEMISAAVTAPIAALLMSMAIHRVFSEGFAVFG